jgi:8-amino-3,8-dideoxy-alpha-D-manno-octulosonate transaminase
LEKYLQVRLRSVVGADGDTGAFLIVTFRDGETAKQCNRALRAEEIITFPQGVNNVVMTDWGLHIYSNIPSQVNQTSTDERGFPWKLAENAN